MDTVSLARLIEADVARALAEDIGSGDVTAALIAPHTQAHAQVIAREAAVVCGGPWFDAVFHALDPEIEIEWLLRDGSAIDANAVLCRLHGPARALLSGERAALNFLQTLSGTATRTQQYVAAVAGTSTRILDTRKTIPGLRQAQKYAVHCGGGMNHRQGLYDAILIKENHIAAAGSVAAALNAATRHAPPHMTVEIEVEDLTELHAALAAGARHILLDNFSLVQLAEAVHITAKRATLEASGGVNLDNVRAVAATGVDFISVGDLTKNIRAVDLSMRIET